MIPDGWDLQPHLCEAAEKRIIIRINTDAQGFLCLCHTRYLPGAVWHLPKLYGDAGKMRSRPFDTVLLFDVVLSAGSALCQMIGPFHARRVVSHRCL